MSRKVMCVLPICLILIMLPSSVVNTDNIIELNLHTQKINTTSGVSNGHTLINKTYFQSDVQTATAVIQREDGGFVLGGFHGSESTQGLILLGADSDGNYEWNQTYCSGSLRRMIMCGDGGYALLGTVWLDGSEQVDWIVVRVNSTCGLQWNQTFGGAGVDYPEGIVELDDGFMVGGSYTNTTRGDRDYMLIRIDQNGTQLWNVTFGDTEDQWFRQLIHCSDGGFIICGYTWNTSTKWDIWLLKTDSSGNHLWNHTISTDEYDTANDIVELRTGGYAIVGGISDGYVGDLLLLRTDAEGNQLWNRTFSGGVNNTYEGFTLLETPDNGFCVRGRNTNTDEEFIIIYWLLRTDRYGNLLWEYPLGEKSVQVYSVINAKGGGFITAGQIGEYGTENWDFHLMLFPELSWINEPVDQLWFTNVAPIPTYRLNVTSAAPIQSWQVNDVHFTIDGTGLLQNTTLLNGTYNLQISVTDSVNNILTSEITIVATEKTLPLTSPPSPTTTQGFQPDTILVAAIGSIAIIVVLVILIRTKGR